MLKSQYQIDESSCKAFFKNKEQYIDSVCSLKYLK